MRHSFLTINKRQSLLIACGCSLGFFLCVAVNSGTRDALREGSGQAPPARTNQARELTIERTYLVHNSQENNAGTELWTMDAATGERNVLVSAETLKAIMQPRKTKSTQATGVIPPA